MSNTRSYIENALLFDCTDCRCRRETRKVCWVRLSRCLRMSHSSLLVLLHSARWLIIRPSPLLRSVVWYSYCRALPPARSSHRCALLDKLTRSEHQPVRHTAAENGCVSSVLFARSPHSFDLFSLAVTSAMTDASSTSDDSTLLVSPSSATKHTAMCRFCGGAGLADELLVPCACVQPSPFVHRACLNNWRAFNLDGHSFLHCNCCLSAYRFQPYTDTAERAVERNLRWQSRTSLFLSVMAIVVLAAMLFLAVFINACDINSAIPPHFPSVSPLMCYFLLALLVLLLLVNLMGVVAYSYGLHLPITQRDNYAQHGGRDYFHPTHRQDFAFVCHPDLFCVSPYGLQREYALLSPPLFTPALDALLLVGIVAVTWLLGLFMGFVVTAYVTWRTGARYIEKLRLETMLDKYKVMDVRETMLEEQGQHTATAVKVSWSGDDRSTAVGVDRAEADEPIGVLPTQQLSTFIADSDRPAEESEQLTKAAVAAALVEDVDAEQELEAEDELASTIDIDKWTWQEAKEEDEHDELQSELNDDSSVEEEDLTDFVTGDQASLDEWLGDGGEATIELQHESEEEKVQEPNVLIVAMP